MGSRAWAISGSVGGLWRPGAEPVLGLLGTSPWPLRHPVLCLMTCLFNNHIGKSKEGGVISEVIMWVLHLRTIMTFD